MGNQSDSTDEQHTTNQHFVPVFFLKNFSDNKKIVYVWDRKNKKYFHNTAESICIEDDLYDEKLDGCCREEFGTYILDNKIEKELCNEEGVASTVIRSIIEKVEVAEGQIVLSSEHKEIIYDFITKLYLRNPYMIKDILEYYNKIDENPEISSLYNGLGYIFEQWKLGNPKPMFDYSIKAGIFHNHMEGSPYAVVRASIDKLNYLFWYSPKKEFVTSSFPLYIIPVDDENISGLMVPISSSVSMVFFAQLPAGINEGMILTPGESIIRETLKDFLNSYSVEMARFFIGRNEEVLRKLL